MSTKLLTLDEFLERNWGKRRTNAYVLEPGFSSLYVRTSRRPIDGEWVDFLDIASVEADNPGQGAFTKLVERLLARGISLYVESVLNVRLASKLAVMGFRANPWVEPPSLFKLVKEGV